MGEVKTIKTLTLCFCFILSFQVGSKRVKVNNSKVTPTELEMLVHRVSNYVFTDKDLEFINTQTIEFLKSEQPIDLTAYNDLTSIYKSAMENVQLPVEQIDMINRYAIALSGFETNKRVLKEVQDIIWLSEARQINDKEILSQFLANQMHSNNWKKSLSLLIEKGLSAEILKFSELIKSNNPGDPLLELAMRKSQVKEKLINFDANNVKDLIVEIDRSITEVMPIVGIKENLRRDHLIWLIKQFGAFRQHNEVKNILVNLSKDDLFYSNKVFDSAPFAAYSEAEKLEIKQLVDERLIISQRAKEALNPNGIIEMDVIE